MEIKKETLKEKIFWVLSIVFVILTFIGAFAVITHKVNNAGYAVVPMLFSFIVSMLYRNSKKSCR